MQRLASSAICQLTNLMLLKCNVFQIIYFHVINYNVMKFETIKIVNRKNIMEANINELIKKNVVDKIKIVFNAC